MTSLDPEADYSKALALKDEGNDAFKKKDYKTALKCYSRIFMYLGMNPSMNMAQMTGQMDAAPPRETDPLKKKTDELRLTAFNNMAAVYASQKEWERCKDKCDSVLNQDPGNVKALFRRARANRHLNCIDLAQSDLKTLSESTDSRVDKKAVTLEKKLCKKAIKDSEKAFAKHMAAAMARDSRKRKAKKKDVDPSAKESSGCGCCAGSSAPSEDSKVVASAPTEATDDSETTGSSEMITTAGPSDGQTDVPVQY